MATAPHRIGRLDFQASVADFDMALTLRTRVETLAWKLVPQVIERVFNSIAPPGLHVRLARIDLDLGNVRHDHLEQDALAALERALAEALAAAIHRARVSPSDDARLIDPAASRLDGFETYLASGGVPLGERFEPVVRLAELAAEQPDALVAMLRRRGRERQVLERLVLQAGEVGLRTLLALLAPADAAVILALIADILLAHRDEALALPRLAAPALERLLWVSTLDYLLRDAGTQFNRRRFLAFLLGREARRAGVDYAELLRLLGDAVARLKARTGFRSSLPVVLVELLAENGQPATLDEPGGQDAFAAARAGDFAPLLALVRSRASNAAALEALVRQLDAALFAGLVQLLEPAYAEQILAILDDLGSARRAEMLPALPEAAFEQRMRFLTLRYLIQDAGSQFNRRRFLGHLLEREARRAGVAYADLLQMLGEAVDQLRARTGLRSAMPAVLAELLDELRPLYDPALADETDRAASALTSDVFERATRRLKPSSAQAILADIAALIALLGNDLAPLVRRVAWRALPREGGRFDRRAWLRTLLDALAVAAQEPEGAVRHALARAVLQGGGGPALSDALKAELEAWARPADTEAPIDETERRRAAEQLDPVNAQAVEAELRALMRLHAAAALLPLDAARFGGVIWALAIAWLRERRGLRFDRRALARHLLHGIARRGGKTLSEVSADVRHSLAQAGAAGDRHFAELEEASRETGEPSDTGYRPAIAHFLRTGQPPSAGRGLPMLVRRDSAWLADLIHRLAREKPGAVPDLVARLLEWLLPEELIECLAPGSAVRAMVWADGVGSGMETWRPAIEALLRGETPPFAPVPGSAGKRLDRLALIAHWLDHGTAAWWSRGGAPTALLAGLETMTLAELSWLFLAGDSERSFARLWRAVEPLGKAARMRLIGRLAPWAGSPSGPLAAALAEAGERRRLEILLRAAVAALEGAQFDMAMLTRPTPPPVSAPNAPPRPEYPAVDPARLFAWLDGAHASDAEVQALMRYFATLADARDSTLIDYLAARRTNTAAQTRWATVLPPEALGRIVQLLVPAGARTLLDAAMTITAAWRQVAPFGARRVDPARIWAMLLAAIAEPGAADVPRVIERLVHGLTRGDAGQASRLRTQAQRLAQDGGHVAVAAALKRAPASPAQPSPSAPKPAKPTTTDEEKPLPAEPDHPIFVGNAGLVLLNPYLPALFERLGLITKNEEGLPRIEGLEAQSRAAHLLQYMADGRTDAPEPELVLNKLLAGVAAAQPVEPDIVATEAELETCNGLLTALVANWPIIRNTSIDGLRETFLRREGRLRHSDGRWDLRVQRKGLDVLVDQIPWTFSMIYHRWMADPIHVIW